MDKSVIYLDGISKSYGKQTVFEDLHYSFNNHGCYLLYGPSGCGKTTLLNILAGLIDFDGSIVFSNKKFENQIDETYASQFVAYISQDNFFVDYLTVKENLMLCTNDENRMHQLLNHFDLDVLCERYPNELSGGQRQRISIIRALLLNKPMILLDEPTANLDRDNKVLVFKMLEELKHDCLLIMSSHDEEILDYCDKVIDFDCLKANEMPSDIHLGTLKSIKRKMPDLWKIMFKEFTYKHREKKSSKILSVVICMTCLIAMALVSPEEKLYTNLERRFDTNQMQVTCRYGEYENLMEILNSMDIDEIVNAYHRNIMQFPKGKRPPPGKYTGPHYFWNAYAIPSNPDLFHRQDLLVEGGYFQNLKDIIVSENFVQEYFPGSSNQEVIGKTVTLDMYEKEDTLTICGVVRNPNNVEAKYFDTSSIGSYVVQQSIGFIFISNDYAKTYLDIPSYTKDKMVYFDLYFDSFSEMMEVYNELNVDGRNLTYFVWDFGSAFSREFEAFVTIGMIFFPILLVCLAISIIFFAHFEKVKQIYKRYNHCVYLYCGYQWKSVYKGLVISEILNKTKILLVSEGIAVLIAVVVNFADRMFGLFDFGMFLIKPYLLVGIGLTVLLTSVLMDVFNFMNIRRYGWFDLLKERRDLV